MNVCRQLCGRAKWGAMGSVSWALSLHAPRALLRSLLILLSVGGGQVFSFSKLERPP